MTKKSKSIMTEFLKEMFDDHKLLMHPKQLKGKLDYNIKNETSLTLCLNLKSNLIFSFKRTYLEVMLIQMKLKMTFREEQEVLDRV